MASSRPPPETPPNRHHHFHLPNFFQSTTAALLSLLPKPSPLPPPPVHSPHSLHPPPANLCIPFHLPDSPYYPLAQSFESTQPPQDRASTVESISSAESNSGFPSAVRIAELKSNGKGGGPAFVGQVFSMCDLSGTGLMAVSTHFNIPFISKRTPEWLKKMFATVTKRERNSPVFRFFMDLGDAVSYVKRLNIPSGVVGACHLDLAYEHFKEKPHQFQFVPNEKQVKAANKLLKKIPQSDGRKIDGVPVFSAQNLHIAIATADGIKWYTPYFFDKNMLDNILEESVDQRFHELIQTRHMYRRRDVIDDNLAAEVIEEMGDSLMDPPEVQEALNEMGHSAVPWNVISKAAEIELLYAVDRVLLGNRWMRKAVGIQPKFPYVVDSFEKRSAYSFHRASRSRIRLSNSKTDETTNINLEDNGEVKQPQKTDHWFPFGDWLSHPWLKQHCKPEKSEDLRTKGSSRERLDHKLDPNPFLPKITMVGISTGDARETNKASLKKTMEDLTRELEQTDQGNGPSSSSNGDEFRNEDRDPLFVANVGNYYSGMSKASSSRWMWGGNKR
ncbi:hypothetical protein Tsubulata_032133 [Turnera subulata]|uniref:Tic22-like family protein n=1 Tax=Turnera subulata TaxID=218843 RepID=A0A9Q0F442_9ROSI|nr:hypothetical protein Tsubulata_032133 [Turnera subulata]